MDIVFEIGGYYLCFL